MRFDEGDHTATNKDTPSAENMSFDSFLRLPNQYQLHPVNSIHSIHELVCLTPNVSDIKDFFHIHIYYKIIHTCQQQAFRIPTYTPQHTSEFLQKISKSLQKASNSSVGG